MNNATFIWIRFWNVAFCYGKKLGERKMQLAIELPDKTNAMIESYSQKIGIEKK